MCRTGIRHCEEKWSRTRRDLDNARRRYNRNWQKGEAAYAAGDRAGADRYHEAADDAGEQMDNLSTLLAEHADQTRESSEFERSMAARSPRERAEALSGLGLDTSVGDGSPEYVLRRDTFDLSLATTARDPHGDEPKRINNKPVGGLWSAPADATPESGFQSEWADVLGKVDEGMTYTQVRGNKDAVVVTISSAEDVKNLARVFPSEDPKQPFSFSSARDAGVDAIRACDENRSTLFQNTDSPLYRWDVSSTVWLKPDNVEVGETFSSGAPRCGSCGQWQGNSHACPSGEGVTTAASDWTTPDEVSEGYHISHRAPGPDEASTLYSEGLLEEWGFNGESSVNGNTLQSRCSNCGRWDGSNHECPAPTVEGPDAQALEDWRSSLSDDEREAWDNYGSIQHAEINERLRQMAGSDDFSGWSDEDMLTVADMDSALRRAPRADQPYVVHRGIQTSRESSAGPRGIDAREWVAANAQPGQEVTFHGFTSTTRDPSQAEYFSGANGDYSTSGVIFEISTTQGGSWGGEGPEQEVTLARGTSFVVDSVDEGHTINGKPYPLVRMREVVADSDNDGDQRCPQCGQFSGAGHTCPAGVPRLSEERERFIRVNDAYYGGTSTGMDVAPSPDVHEVITEFAQTELAQEWVAADGPVAGNCDEVSEEFAKALRAKGIDAQPILGLDEDDDGESWEERRTKGDVRYHVVTCVHHEGQHLHVDWTAKQYAVTQMDLGPDELLENDPLAAQNLPTPMVWDADKRKGTVIGTVGDWSDRAPGEPRTTLGHFTDRPNDDGPSSGGHPLASQPAEPMEFRYMRNTASLSGNQAAGHDFGQDAEPAGRYMVEGVPSGAVPDGWEGGTVRFDKPLHVNWGSGSYADDDNWKKRLSAHYGGKTGEALSQALRDDGYDAIVTHDKYGTSEVVDLTHLKPSGGSPSEKGRSGKTSDGPKWNRRKKYAPKDSYDYGKVLEARYGEGVQVWLGGGSDGDSYVSLSKIFIPKERRGEGLGKKIMADIVAEADRNEWRMSLTPDGEWGSSVTRLKKFYGDFGFVANKGRAKDYRTQDSMVRQPS